MKRFSIILLTAMMVIGIIPKSVNAATIETPVGTVVSETVEYLPDGSSIITTVIDETVPTRAATYTKTGSKVQSQVNSSGDIMWQFTVRGTFSVNPGVSATCTAVSHSVNIVNDAWENESASSWRSSNKACGTATCVRKVLFITVETREANVTLTCDSNGNLS